MRIIIKFIIFILSLILIIEMTIFAYSAYYKQTPSKGITNSSDQSVNTLSPAVPKSIFEPNTDCNKDKDLCNYLLTQEKRHKQYTESGILVSSMLTEKLVGTISVIEKTPGQWETVNDRFEKNIVSYAKRIVIESTDKSVTYAQVFTETLLNNITVTKVVNGETMTINFDELNVGDKIEITNTLDGLSPGLFQTIQSIQITQVSQ